MKEYFITIMIVALAGGIIVSLASQTNAQRNIKFLCGLCTVACIAFPLVNIAEGDFDKNAILDMFDYGENDEEYYDEIYNLNLENNEISNAKATLKSEILKELDAKNEDFDLNIITSKLNDKIYIDRVETVIYPEGIGINPREIQAYVNKRLGCECVIFYD